MFLSLFKKKSKKKNLHTIGFYNLENLFDTIDDPDTLDDDFTPNGSKKWTNRRYKKKVYKLAKTISKLGIESTGHAPVLLGVAEVENREVMTDLISAEPLRDITYDYVHYDSPDERGIDTALIYDTTYFKVIASEPITLYLENPNGERDTTRDILYVYGKLNNEDVHVFVNHWPSRRSGDVETEYKRLKAADTIIERMQKIEEKHLNPNYIIMGDFNDEPSSASIQKLMNTQSLYNPMEKLHSPLRGSANYRKNWSLFDQIIISHNFFDYKKGTHSYTEADIFDERFLKEWEGKFKGNPYRTYVGTKYLGGYSDHFPVYIQLKFNK